MTTEIEREEIRELFSKYIKKDACEEMLHVEGMELLKKELGLTTERMKKGMVDKNSPEISPEFIVEALCELAFYEGLNAGFEIIKSKRKPSKKTS